MRSDPILACCESSVREKTRFCLFLRLFFLVMMVRRKTWDKEVMKKAIVAIRNKELGYKAASKMYNVPRSTLKNYVQKGVDRTPEELVDTKIGRKPILPINLEKQLVNYCTELENNFYGLMVKDLQRIAYQLTIRNNIVHLFSSTKLAGRKWMRLFLKRHPELSLRKPRPLARIQGFTPENVQKFFSILKSELAKVKYNPVKVYNVGETGISIVQHNSNKVVVLKEKAKIQKLSSEMRGSLVTVVMCISAAGQYVPPLMIFPRKLMKEELLDGAPPGAIGAVHESGWITDDLFEKWFQHFLSIIKPSKEDPVVLILDGHYSYIRNINVIDSARENDVSIVCLPPNSTAKMHPLDVAFMFPFKNLYAQAIENWLSNHPGRIITNLQLARLFNEAYEQAADIKTAVSGFRKTGIIPFNPNVFGKEDFLLHKRSRSQTGQGTSTEFRTNTISQQLSRNQCTRSKPIDSPQKTQAVPVIQPSTSARRGSAVQVNSSSHKRKIENASTNKKAPPRKRLMSQMSQSPKKKKVKASRRKRIPETSSDSECSDDIDYISTDNEDSEDECSICGKDCLSERHDKKWVQCTKCFLWCHELCSNVQDQIKFICDTC